MGTPTPINLQNAGLFSALAYAPSGTADSMAWALAQPATSAVHQDALALQAMDWCVQYPVSN